MNQLLPISKKILNQINTEVFIALETLFKRKIKSHDDIFKFLRKHPNYRSQVFDLVNMLPVLCYVNYEIKKFLEKKIIKKTLVNWTYAQIRLDDVLSKKFSAPAHKDRWIIDKNKTGYIVWIPLKKEGSSLMVAKKDLTKRIKLNSYWGLEAIGPTEFTRKKIAFGKALLFDADLLHKSDNPKHSRITLQLRYEEICNKKFKRTVTQKVDDEVLKFWKKELI